jgi:hypothetical protein
MGRSGGEARVTPGRVVPWVSSRRGPRPSRKQGWR